MQRRIEEIDILRGICALAVVLIHTSAVYLRPTWETTVPFLFVSGLNVVSKFAVQVFIFISGFVLFYVYKDKEYDIGEFYLKRINSVFIPYFFWMVIYIAHSGTYLSMSFTEALMYLFSSLLTSKAAFHMYFILLILQFYLVFPLFQKLLRRYKFSLTFLISITALYLIIMYVDYYVAGLGKLGISKAILKYRSRYFILWYIYFIFGAYAAYYADILKEKLQKYMKPAVVLMAISFALATVDFFVYVKYLSYDMSYAATPLKPSIFIYSMLSIIVLYGYSIKLAKKETPIKKALLFVSKYSLTLYFAHPLMLQYIFRLKLIPWSVGNLLITYIITVALTLFLTVVITRNKKTAALVGVS